jgi:hypothetical protein
MTPTVTVVNPEPHSKIEPSHSSTSFKHPVKYSTEADQSSLPQPYTKSDITSLAGLSELYGSLRNSFIALAKT